ncbi:unnamed protein product [Spodoptera littoralis]|uniref:Uncharacterized protein n=1 Tax=Spodoptera littoralis TaxID=7109 RepID=A0A9P0N881_SPOLI|nr:unnamed protein product [Spodoptera littoralis]CAH1645998.1 unnamed protein product [Spodoptera littoralis]
MNKRQAAEFLFTIAKEIQQSFASPVIFFTQKDYAENIFDVYKKIRKALLANVSPETIIDIVYEFHMEWLQAVQEIENFKENLKEIPRNAILKVISFTMECVEQRYQGIRKYIGHMQASMTNDEYSLMQTDLSIIKDLQNIVISSLTEKYHYISSLSDHADYYARINDEIEELLFWLDKLNDNVAIEFCKILDFKVPLGPVSLTTTLQEIVEEVAANPSPEAKKILEIVHIKGQMLSTSIRHSSVNELEISKIIEKIRALENRIKRLQTQNSSALMALKHKTTFLEERLQSLENIKKSINNMRQGTGDQGLHENLKEPKDIHIFSHLLPHHDRCRLIDKLLQLWKSAMIESEHQSVISILSVADLAETFTDDNGCFTVDKYGRKIYRNVDDDQLYQLNERNKLVPLQDDDKCVYFYDACGRYYISEARKRIYKDHDGASEYMLTHTGYLVKVLEEIDGVQYFYDWLGRYYIRKEDGRQIYTEKNSTDEYEQDGLGNLVKIHPDPVYYEPCPLEPITMKENEYLQQEVGQALKKCITQVVLTQPKDPVACLADCLIQYSKNIKAHQQLMNKEKERFELSQLLHLNTPKDVSVICSSAEEAEDFNFINYGRDTDTSFNTY